MNTHGSFHKTNVAKNDTFTLKFISLFKYMLSDSNFEFQPQNHGGI